MPGEGVKRDFNNETFISLLRREAMVLWSCGATRPGARTLAERRWFLKRLGRETKKVAKSSTLLAT